MSIEDLYHPLSTQETLTKKESFDDSMTGEIIASKESPEMQEIRTKLQGIRPDGFEESIRFISQSSTRDKDAFLSIINDDFSFPDIQDYIKKNGYPNSITFKNFEQQFFPKNTILNTKIGIEKTQEGDEKSILHLKEIYSKLAPYKSQLLKNGVDAKLLENLEKLNEGNQELLPEVKKGLLDNNGNLEKILKTFKQIDAENAKKGQTTHLYEGIKQTFSSYDPSFEARIQTFERFESTSFENASQTPALETVQIQGTLGNSPSQYGNILSNGDVNVDISQNPPYTFMNSENGYNLDVDMPVGDYYPSTVALENSKQTLEPKISGAEKGLDYLRTLVNEQSVKELSPTQKGVLKNLIGNDLYAELGIDGKTNISTIGTNLSEKRAGYIQEMQSAQLTYQASLKKSLANYTENQKVKQEMLRKRLDFLSSIGFDVIPQSVSDTIIAEINRNPTLKSKIGMSGEGKIDIQNGEFGVKVDADTNDISRQESDMMRNLVNLMVTGTTDGPVKRGQSISPSDLRQAFLDTNHTGTLWGIATIRANVNK